MWKSGDPKINMAINSLNNSTAYSSSVHQDLKPNKPVKQRKCDTEMEKNGRWMKWVQAAFKIWYAFLLNGSTIQARRLYFAHREGSLFETLVGRGGIQLV